MRPAIGLIAAVLLAGCQAPTPPPAPEPYDECRVLLDGVNNPYNSPAMQQLAADAFRDRCMPRAN